MTVVVGTGLPFWTGESDDWQDLILGGTRWPGVWVISGSGVRRALDLKKAKGSDVATLKDEGYKNAELTATGTIWTAEQWSTLQAILPEVHPRTKGGTREPLQIIHPAANLLGVDSVYLRGISIPEIDFAKGGPMTIELDMIEWTPAPAPVKTTGGGGGGGAKAEEVTTEDILNQLQNLAGNMGDSFNESLETVKPIE